VLAQSWSTTAPAADIGWMVAELNQTPQKLALHSIVLDDSDAPLEQAQPLSATIFFRLCMPILALPIIAFPLLFPGGGSLMFSTEQLFCEALVGAESVIGRTSTIACNVGHCNAAQGGFSVCRIARQSRAVKLAQQRGTLMRFVNCSQVSYSKRSRRQQ
jgi:hypothetical protein